MNFQYLKFQDFLHPRPEPKGLDVQCKLQHFALISYAIDPIRFKDLIPPRFKLDTIQYQGQEKALMSVVPFLTSILLLQFIHFQNFKWDKPITVYT